MNKKLNLNNWTLGCQQSDINKEDDLDDAAYNWVMGNFGDPKESLFDFDCRCFKAGAGFAVQRIISLIESRIAEILGDAQPAPVLRIELQELIDKIKEESK